MPSWRRIARRIRVPLGFVFAIVFLYFARATWTALAIGAAITLVGLTVRAIASGHVRKDRELTTTGPYAHTRNPLYLGSVLVATGFALASRNWWIAAGIAAMFVAIYLPVIRDEEEYLRARFPEYQEYEQKVPRFLPKLAEQGALVSDFSRERYFHHREYRAAVGAALMLAALAAKILWSNR